MVCDCSNLRFHHTDFRCRKIVAPQVFQSVVPKYRMLPCLNSKKRKKERIFVYLGDDDNIFREISHHIFIQTLYQKILFSKFRDTLEISRFY